MCTTDTNGSWKGDQGSIRASGGFNRGGGGGAPATQRRMDNGWEGRRGYKETMGSLGSSINQMEAHKQGNMGDVGSFAKDRDKGTSHQSNNRKYKQGTQKEVGASQTTLNEFWKGKEKDLRTWLEEMEELEGLESLRVQNSQDSALSYV